MVLVAAGQFCAKAALSKNLEAVSGIITDAARAGAKMIFLPEASDFIANNADESASLTKPLPQNEFVQGVRAKAKETGVWVSVGVHETSLDPKRGFNSHLLIDSSGEVVSNYHKIHLFDVDIPGGTRLMESDTTMPGDRLHDPIETPAGKRLLTCYDIRFPEAAQVLKSRGAEILAYPSAFTARTGAAHWEVLLRSRAIETQSYVIGAAAVGQHSQTRTSWGHAMIVDPWGTILAQCTDLFHEQPTFCLANVDLGGVREIRTRMPVDKQRRTDIYPTV